jgi:hypothetical protein
MPPNPTADSAELQDTAATRLLPVWVAAAQWARSNGGEDEEMPESIKITLKLAIIAALTAAWSSMRRRARQETPAPPEPVITDVETPSPRPTPGLNPNAVRVTDIEERADAIATSMSGTIVRACNAHVKNSTPDTDKVFAKRAAYSSSAELMSLAQLDFAEELGMKYKIWISRSDKKVRLLHRKLHGKPVKLNESFYTWPTGQELGFPGDPRAPLDAIINCRCVMFVAMTKVGIEEALAPANLEEAFSLAASIERSWIGDVDDDGC